MDTVKRFGIKKSKAILLFVQMLLTLFLLVVSIYLLVFSISNNLGGWMISSYVLITVSVIAAICYSIVGFKKGYGVFRLSILPFLAAVLVNVLLPNRETFQIALLTILFAPTFAFLLRPNDWKFTSVIGLLMLVVSLTFSIYSAIKADVSFLGEVSKNWPTYVAMYASIFIPTVMSTMFGLVYNVRSEKGRRSSENTTEI